MSSWVSRGITEYWKTRKTLEDSEDRFRRLSDVATEAICIHYQGKIIDFNHAFEAMFRYSRDEFLQMWAWDVIDPRDIPRAKEMVRLQYEDPYEVRGLRKDGSIFPMEIYSKHSWMGEKSVRVTAIHDLTQRKQAEESVRLLSQAVEQSPVAVVNADGIVQYVNSAHAEMTGHGDVRVCVNVSPRQFQDVGFIDDVRVALTGAGLPAANLELEITEGLLLAERGDVDILLRSLGEMGVRLSIDDFGTGYSSLSYLERFPFDTLKIDRSFLIGMLERQERKVLVETIVAMASGLGLEVIAEGVETAEQLGHLAAINCDIAQGYLFSRPVVLAEALAMLGQRFPVQAGEVPDRRGHFGSPASVLDRKGVQNILEAAVDIVGGDLGEQVEDDDGVQRRIAGDALAQAFGQTGVHHRQVLVFVLQPIQGDRLASTAHLLLDIGHQQPAGERAVQGFLFIGKRGVKAGHRSQELGQRAAGGGADQPDQRGHAGLKGGFRYDGALRRLDLDHRLFVGNAAFEQRQEHGDAQCRRAIVAIGGQGAIGAAIIGQPRPFRPGGVIWYGKAVGLGVERQIDGQRPVRRGEEAVRDLLVVFYQKR
ncbi:MAG: EAL domain-containing protein [Phaeospirillum sp.]|nr:EAL domain-containing protein [Phaeospirillum sp.]